ncbi:hypothetical protein BBJ28_00014978 [Nothophytophthora sp. Chile5]|nr:hypothetical protein BBJ28_00014978 [Nothophytophthora sp. Chile5]
MGEIEVRSGRTPAVPRSSRVLDPLLRPTELRDGFQVSVHSCPRLMLRELMHVFPAQFGRKAVEPVLAILTCQKSLMDLSQFGEDADKEKDRLLETFVAFAQQVATQLAARQFWVDFIDPCSGLPFCVDTNAVAAGDCGECCCGLQMLTLSSNKVYSEVDGVELLLRYRCLSAGMCKILVHPVWGAAVYPASLFTNAPFEVVQEVLLSLPEKSWLLAESIVDQDSRYFSQNKKLLAKMSFPPCFDERVDLAKVQREVINQWVTERITELLGFEDDIVVSMAINLLEPKVDERLDPRQLQVALTGFLEKQAAPFTQELWELLLSAQANATGIPNAILDKKKQEMESITAEKEKLRKVLDAKRADIDAQRVLNDDLAVLNDDLAALNDDFAVLNDDLAAPDDGHAVFNGVRAVRLTRCTMFSAFRQGVDAITASGSDAEVAAFLAKEAEEADPKRKKEQKKRKNVDEDLPKLFMELSWSEQRKVGTNAPVLRQVEGDSINHRIRLYRSTLFFHIHGKTAKRDRFPPSLTYRSVVRLVRLVQLEMRWTPLHYAVMGGHEKIVERLADKAPVRRITINRKDVRCSSALPSIIAWLL